MALAVASLVSKLKPDVEAYRRFLDLALADICKQGGAVYVGIQPQLVPQIPELVLFHSPKHRSTVGIPLRSITPMAVASRVQMSDVLFEAASRPAPVPVQPTLKLAWLPKTPPRSRFRLAKRIHKMISRDGREWDSVIENFRQIRSGRKQS